MTRLRIKDAPLIETSVIQEDLKIPTGGYGDVVMNLSLLSDWVMKYKNIATKEYVNTTVSELSETFATKEYVSEKVEEMIEPLPDKGYVDTKFSTLSESINRHLQDFNNPHKVSKNNIGLGNVDNTSDKDKPLSIAAINALSNKADKTYINEKFKYVEDNGAALPWVSDIEYTEGAVVVKDGVLVQFKGGEWVNVGAKTDAELMTWSGRTQESRNKEIYSILDFWKKGDTSLSQALQRAIAPNRAIYIPSDEFVFLNDAGTININQQGFSLFGEGRAVFKDWDLGQTCMHVGESDFSCSGVSLECVGNRAAFFRVFNLNKDIDNFYFTDVKFLNGLYSVRGGTVKSSDNLNPFKIKNMNIVTCNSIGRVSEPSGHFLMSSADIVKYIGNNTEGGRNTSVYGANFSKNIIITGNTERGVFESGSGAEASIQIEDCEGSSTLIYGNTVSHDIWVSGSSGVDVFHNHCKTLRVSVGNVLGHDVENVEFSKNTAASINISKYGAADVPHKYSAEFNDNTIDPLRALLIGRDIPTRAIQYQGGYAKRISINDTKVVSSAKMYQASISRGGDGELILSDNNFGNGAHIVSGNGGYILESNSKNPIFPVMPQNPSADIGLTNTREQKVSTLSSWIGLSGFTKSKDLNSAYNASSGELQLKSGLYNISVKIGVSVKATGDTLGLRLVDASNFELGRIVFEKSIVGTSMFSGSLNFSLNADSVVRIEVFSEQEITLIASAATSNISITSI